MADVLFLLLTAAFFALCVGYVRLCDRIVGPDPVPDSGTERALEADRVTA